MMYARLAALVFSAARAGAPRRSDKGEEYDDSSTEEAIPGAGTTPEVRDVSDSTLLPRTRRESEARPLECPTCLPVTGCLRRNKDAVGQHAMAVVHAPSSRKYISCSHLYCLMFCLRL